MKASSVLLSVLTLLALLAIQPAMALMPAPILKAAEEAADQFNIHRFSEKLVHYETKRGQIPCLQFDEGIICLEDALQDVEGVVRSFKSTKTNPYFKRHYQDDKLKSAVVFLPLRVKLKHILFNTDGPLSIEKVHETWCHQALNCSESTTFEAVKFFGANRFKDVKVRYFPDSRVGFLYQDLFLKQNDPQKSKGIVIGLFIG